MPQLVYEQAFEVISLETCAKECQTLLREASMIVGL